METEIKPTVHLNGTGKDSLFKQACEVASVCFDLLKALSDAAPNGRDYYLQKDPDAFKKARVEFEIDAKNVKTLMDKWQEIATLIDEQ